MQECAAGTYSSGKQTTCSTCQAGKFSLHQASECTTCAPACAPGSSYTSACTDKQDIQCAAQYTLNPPWIVVNAINRTTAHINSSGHRYYSFLSSVGGATIQFPVDTIVSILVVGGGGGGGGSISGGGGGGAVVYVPNAVLRKHVEHRAVVGAGGAVHASGVASSFAGVSAIGGGAGGGTWQSYCTLAGTQERSGQDGGSGGGSSGTAAISATRQPIGCLAEGGKAIARDSSTGLFAGSIFGNQGGSSLAGMGTSGGGGAALRADDAHNNGNAPSAWSETSGENRKGGDGKLIDIDGLKQYWAGGGGGGIAGHPQGMGGKGGGGAGGSMSNYEGMPDSNGEVHVYSGLVGNGTTNTGGGGGGHDMNSLPKPYHGAGGSGIVIVRILGPSCGTRQVDPKPFEWNPYTGIPCLPSSSSSSSTSSSSSGTFATTPPGVTKL
jgi:hypothetical protein